VSAQQSVLVQIARPYANALFDLAGDSKALPAIEKSLDGLSKSIEGSQDLKNFLSSPVIASDAKASAMNAVLDKAKLPDLVANTVKVVAANGRLFVLPAIISEFKRMAAEARGEVTAEVTSAAPLSAAQSKSLADTLKKKIGKTVNITSHVDPELIGGLVVKVGSQMIDSSLKTKLTAMKIAMKEVG
jgi:F-type H+-transporting ATPase subunit delta